MDVIDLRSDTVTRPSRRMRPAMVAAEVGDDQFAEDPTTDRLQNASLSCWVRGAAPGADRDDGQPGRAADLHPSR
ncbi:MAG: beta-eliminating lyase-related protein [Chloroflexota bacterium]